VSSVTSAVAGIPCAIGAAAAFGIANVEQMRAARKVEAPERLSATFVVRLVRERRWWLGIAASVVAYLLQAAALYVAPIVLVQPLIVTELLFALPLASRLGGRRLGVREWGGAAAVACGITAFVVVGRPSGASVQIPMPTMTAIGAGSAGAVVILVLVAEAARRRPMVRASLLALAASVCFGLLSVTTKVVGHEFARDHLATLIHPQPYILAASAITGLLLAQTAFRIAPLSVALPLIDIGEPTLACLLAIVGLHEKLDLGAATTIGVAVALAAVATGVAVLDSSPLVRDTQREISANLSSPLADDASQSLALSR
jgi:drug/metabolite transporter (DMT)-like permease